MLNYDQLSRLKRIHEVTDWHEVNPGPEMKSYIGEPGFYFEFEGTVHSNTHCSVRFVGSEANGSDVLVEKVPSVAKIVARRICPFIMEWEDHESFRVASIEVPQLSAFIRSPHLGGYEFRVTTDNSTGSGRWYQRGIDVQRYLERDGLIKFLMFMHFKRDAPTRPTMLVKLDDELRILLKLKFTKARH